MGINKNKLLRAFKADFKAAEELRNQQDSKIQQWKDEFSGKPYGNEVKGKSQIVSKDIKKQSAWQHSSLIEPFVSTNDIVKVSPITWEDEAGARQAQQLLNYQFCRQFPRYNFMSKALKVLDQEGTLVVQCGWDYEDEEVEVMADTIVELDDGSIAIDKVAVTETKVLRNQPTAVVCRNEDIFIDPTCMDDMDKCQFVIHRYETDLSTLRSDGRYKNLDKVAKSGYSSDTEYDFDDEDETEFMFEDEPRKKLLVHEYWGNYDMNGDGIAEAVVCAWIGDVVIRLQSNPYPDGKPPFLIVPFNSVPFQMYGESDAELISDNQKVKTAITRGIIDNMAQSNNGQIGVRKGALDATNRKKWLNGQNFEFNGTPGDFWNGSYNEIPASAFNILGLQSNEIESLTGVKSFSGGISGNSLGQTATGARGALDATSVRRLDRVRNISENLIKPLMRKWLAYSSEFLDDEEIIRVTNEEFVPIRRDDLSGNVDLEISVSTAEDNAAKSQELSFLLQTLGNTLPFEATKAILAKIVGLQKLPDVEKEVRELEPPKPDPMQQQMMQLEMQEKMKKIQKLDAEIAAIYSGAREDDADRFEKISQAQYKLAQTRKLNSESDKLDLEFLRVDEGMDHKEKLELEEHKRLADLDRMAYQTMHGDKNIGL